MARPEEVASMMLAITCPPCGTKLTAETEAELVALAQQHARDEHAMEVDADEVIEEIVLLT
jgi:predicted small metal-binding protein